MFRLLKLCKPGKCLRYIWEIDLPSLAEEGVKCIIMDLDNTLLPWKSSNVPDECLEWIDRAKKCGIKMCIVSNTHNSKRLEKIAKQLDVYFIDRALKPRPQSFLKALGMLNESPEHAVVVGDQVLTDILGGNLVGMKTIYVQPMHPKEFIGTKLNRLIERAIFALLRRQNEMGTISDSIQSETREEN